ncbi:MAG: tRNA (guanosine(37)-N1)-methyltransferase TrmD [Candidatus Saccharimonadales bacterium]
MKISIITLFPDMFTGPFAMSMLKKAQDKGLLEIEFIDLRDFGIGPNKQVDDSPYGGGDGMLLKVEPVVAAIEQVQSETNSNDDIEVILLTPKGTTYKQSIAKELASKSHLVLVCGHYEGFDERIREFVDLEISVGDYVLTGGEIPAMAIVDSVARLIPGVLGGERSALDESFSDGKTLEHPHYSRPEEFRGRKVPDVLLSGNHGEIAKWRQDNSQTKKN